MGCRRRQYFHLDFDTLETEGGLYLLPEYSAGDSHPNDTFAQQVAPLFGQRLVNVIEGRGDSTSLTGNRLDRANFRRLKLNNKKTGCGTILVLC